MSAITVLVSIMIAVEFLFGSSVGLAVAAVIYRSRLRIRLAISAMFCAGAAFLCASGLAGWADISTSFMEGHDVATASWANCPRLASYLVDNRLALCITSSIITAAISSFYLRGRTTQPKVSGQSSP
jgi:hypothetical protein